MVEPGSTAPQGGVSCGGGTPAAAHRGFQGWEAQWQPSLQMDRAAHFCCLISQLVTVTSQWQTVQEDQTSGLRPAACGLLLHLAASAALFLAMWRGPTAYWRHRWAEEGRLPCPATPKPP